MHRFVLPAVLAFVIACSPAGSSPAAADIWGCSYDKCIAVCGQAGGKYCSAYCNKQLAEKQRSKVCK